MLLMILKKIYRKAMERSVCGNTMKNLQKGINMRLVNNAEDFFKYTSKPTYITHKILVKIMLLFMKLNRF